MWKLHDPGGLPFEIAREIDRVLYKTLGPGHGPPATVGLKDGKLETNPITRLAGRL